MSKERRSISDLTSPEVAALLGRRGLVVMPIGSVEQHGPHLPCGTDTMAADLVATKLAEILNAIVVPAGPYGVTPIHAGHPGTISLRRNVFESYLSNLCEEMVAMGANTFVFVNWHEGNIGSLDSVATDLQANNDVLVVTAHACYTAQRIYTPAGGELTHGGGIEALAILAHDPDLAHVDRAGRPTRPEGAEELDAMRRSREIYGYITDVTEIADEGWYGDPAWADEERAREFAQTVADEVAVTVESILKMRRDRR
ncbi:MAG TPA: creatininase family protein [Acidimicrobiia bacterium]|nr:creatininase family protein [Acidimicrobiia bacterium]